MALVAPFGWLASTHLSCLLFACGQATVYTCLLLVAVLPLLLCVCVCVQVDRWLQPYLQLALTCLTKAENRLLRDELLVFVANALYYNAAATMQLLQQFNAVQQLFGMWFGFIFERK